MMGIPVLVKDNIDVEGLPTTAGSVALAHSYPADDAPLIKQLKAAGAIILGKTNMAEFAFYMTSTAPNGYSSLGGQVLNPYDAALNPGGSAPDPDRPWLSAWPQAPSAPTQAGRFCNRPASCPTSASVRP